MISVIRRGFKSSAAPENGVAKLEIRDEIIRGGMGGPTEIAAAQKWLTQHVISFQFLDFGAVHEYGDLVEGELFSERQTYVFAKRVVSGKEVKDLFSDEQIAELSSGFLTEFRAIVRLENNLLLPVDYATTPLDRNTMEPIPFKS